MKELKIEIPEGHEIDTERSTFERIVFRPVKSTLPKTWEELNSVNGYYTKYDSTIGCVNYAATSKATNRNVFAELDQAEAAIALAQLSQLKKAYNGTWVPDWKDATQVKYTIEPCKDFIAKGESHSFPSFLTFKDEEMRDLFLENFRDLIEQAKPLMS